MKEKQVNTFLKGKIALGYFLIFVASALAVLFLYQGIKNLQLLDKANTSPNVKLHKINEILTLIYEAENQTRTYFLFRNQSDFDDYIRILNSIDQHIDTLSVLCIDNYKNVNRLSLIKELLLQKKNVVNQLREIKNPDKRDFLYTRALEEIYIQAYDISKMSRVVKEKVTITRDTVVEAAKRKNFVQRVKGLFSDKAAANGNLAKVAVEYQTKLDTVLQEGISPDSVVKTLQRALENLRFREDYLEGESTGHETQLLYSDRVLLDKIREIITLLETEELASVGQVLNKSTDILHQATYVSMLIAVVSVVVIIIFLVLIFRDISMGRGYQLALQAAKQHTEELMKLKEQFLANMSHEIRTPLGTIIGFTEQLQKTPLEPTQKQYLNTIDKASEHLLGLVNDILDLSKIDAGKFLLEKVRFNLNDLLHEVSNAFSLGAKEKGIALFCNVEPGLNCELIGDPFRVRQVMINMVGNALKFTDTGSITIEASMIATEEKNYIARISVIDTGIGIPLEKQQEIFLDFSQADAGTARKYGGTGLGLAISKKIIELHGGKITLQSVPGEGSSFIVELPFEVPSNYEDIPEVVSNAVVPSSFFAGKLMALKGKKILAVEDDETTLLLITFLLKEVGVEIVPFSDSSLAIEMLGTTTFDLVLTDIHMPGISGIELLQLIRSHPQPSVSQLPVIALTANVPDRNALLGEGFTDYLSKPFKEEPFYSKIAEVFSPSGLRDKVYETAPIVDETIRNAPYSLSGISAFTGNDPDALQLVVGTFVEKSRLVISELRDLIEMKDLKGISARAHKLLPTFKQFQIIALVPDLENLERYEERGLPEEELLMLAAKVTDGAETILKQIEEEMV